MKIKKERLREIIKEEIEKVHHNTSLMEDTLTEEEKKHLRKQHEKEQLQEEIRKEWQLLSETSIYRLVTTYMEDGFIIVSADRSCEAESGVKKCSEEQAARQEQLNRENRNKLKQVLRRSGFGYVPTLGGFKEALNDKETGEPVIDPETGDPVLVDTEFPERSFVVHSRKGDKRRNPEELRQLGLDIANQFNQDSILYKPPNAVDPKAYYLTRNGEVDIEFADLTVEDLDQIFYTQLAKGTQRRYSHIPENYERAYYILKPPNGMQEAIKRYGETFYRMK
tara:strand:- start:1613 stop:2452 length:840 start_codon:yes stop_codon:yes gene_type:complete